MMKHNNAKDTSLVEEIEKRGRRRIITGMLAEAVVLLMVLLNPSPIFVDRVESAKSAAEQPGAAQVLSNVTRVMGRKGATTGTLATTLALH